MWPAGAGGKLPCPRDAALRRAAFSGNLSALPSHLVPSGRSVRVFISANPEGNRGCRARPAAPPAARRSPAALRRRRRSREPRSGTRRGPERLLPLSEPTATAPPSARRVVGRPLRVYGLGGTGVLRSPSFVSVNDTPERQRGAGHPLIFALSGIWRAHGDLETRTRAAF